MWKKQITKLEQRPHIELLRSLAPFRHCDDLALDALGRRSEMLQAVGGHVLFGRKYPETEAYFVVDGDIKLIGDDGDIRIVSGGSVLSHFPLNPWPLSDEDAVVLDAATLIRVDRSEMERMSGHAQDAGRRATRDIGDENIEEQLYIDFYTALQSGTLEIPSMPGIGVRIAKHLEEPDADSDSIARIVQLDPALTVRLIQVANSPLFGGRIQIESCRDAVTRLGQSTTRDLVIGFVLKGIFRSRHPILQKRMEEIWRHSTQVAAISQVLARKTPGLDPQQAMLAGLMHDIGAIPILTGATRYPRVAESDVLLDRVLQRLRGECGAMTLRKWEFAPEFVNVALHAEDWQREGGHRPDYTDVVIIAQMHGFIGTPRIADVPRIDTVPAFRKMALGALSPRMSLKVMDEAEEEVNAMQQLLI